MLTSFRLTLTLILCYVLFPTFLNAQTIINTEQLLASEDSLVFNLTIDYQGTNGNLKTNQLQALPSVFMIGTKNDYKLVGGYSFLSEGTNSIYKQGFVHVRHAYKFNKIVQTFTFYQLQFNEVLLLNKRELIGSGLKFSTFQKDSIDLDFGVGAMQENEILNPTLLNVDEVIKTNFLRGSFFVSFSYIFKNSTKITNISYYQPHFSNFSDYRLFNDLQLTFKVSKKIDLTALFNTRYDSKPPSILKRIDNNFGTGIKFSF